MSSYAFFVQTCREEHKKQHPDASVNFPEFSKKCPERWRPCLLRRKENVKARQRRTGLVTRETGKLTFLLKGKQKRNARVPMHPGPCSAFFLFCSEFRPKIKGEHPGLPIGDVAKKLGERWSHTAADDKQPREKKSAKLKEKYGKDIAADRAKGKPDAAKKGVVKAEKSKKKKEEEEDEEEEEEEEEKEEEEEEDDDDE